MLAKLISLSIGKRLLFISVEVEINLKLKYQSSANAAPEFQGRGGEKVANHIVNILSNIFSLSNFDLGQLCIVEGKKCWHLYVDIVVK